MQSTRFYELNFNLSFYTSCQTSFTWILACQNINDMVVVCAVTFHA